MFAEHINNRVYRNMIVLLLDRECVGRKMFMKMDFTVIKRRQ